MKQHEKLVENVVQELRAKGHKVLGEGVDKRGDSTIRCSFFVEGVFKSSGRAYFGFFAKDLQLYPTADEFQQTHNKFVSDACHYVRLCGECENLKALKKFGRHPFWWSRGRNGNLKRKLRKVLVHE